MTPEQTARAEFVRALNTLQQVQLRTFAHGEPPSKGHYIERLDTLAITDLTARCETMRALIKEATSQYNDGFCNYMGPAAYQRYTDRRRGGLVGVGLKFRARDDGYPWLIGVIEGGPLENTGPEPGDLIEAIDGQDMHGASAKEVSAALSGVAGSEVHIVFRRGEAVVEQRVRRQDVTLHYVRAERLPEGVSHIRFSRFGGKSHERFAAVLDQQMKTGARAIVLDLRSNPGGSTRAARHIFSMFDAADTVYCERYRSGAVKRMPRSGEVRCKLPLKILQNGGSMSSSEILAGALRERGRAQIIGEPSYGKGLIQKVFALKDPLGGALRATIAAYATPQGQLLHGVGLLPDRYVADDPDQVHVERGSLNISAEARAFRRQLLQQDLAEKVGAAEARRRVNSEDLMLGTALELIG